MTIVRIAIKTSLALACGFLGYKLVRFIARDEAENFFGEL